MPITGPSITVDHNTTRGQLEAFLKANTQSGDRVLGKTDKQTGATVLYVSQNKAGLLDRMTGRAADRRSDARAAVETVFKNYDAKLTRGGLTEGGSNVKNFLFTKLTERVNAHDTSALRSGELRQILADAKVVGQDLPTIAGAVTQVPQAPRPGPTVLDTGLTPQDFKTLATGMAAVNPATDTDGKLATGLTQIADTLGATIATTYGQAHTGNGEREAFAFSDGAALRTQMAKVLATVLPPGTLSTEVLNDFTARVFDQAAARLSPDKVVSGADTAIPAAHTGTATITLPSITIGTKTYEPVRFLGVGGFAKVYEYKSTTDNERIAFKIPNPSENRAEVDEATNNTAAEVAAHRAAQGGGHANVVGLKGAVRMEDGRIGMALEFASSGDVFGMTDKINDAVGTGPGKITQAQADLLRLTLVKDMAEGLRHIRGQNMIHFDFKTPNVMIGGDGVAKVADFGTSRAGADIRAVDAPEVDNPTFQAPEMLYSKEHIAGSEKRITNNIKLKTDFIADGMKAIFVGATDGQIKQVCQTILKPEADAARAREAADNANLRIANQADTWALGMATANLFLGLFDPGMNPGERVWTSTIQERIAAFGQNPNGVALAPRQADGSLAPGSLSGETHSAPVTALINRMLSPDPDDRPSLDDVLGSAPLSARGVGGQQAHALLAALATGDANAIDTAKGRLAGRMQLTGAAS